MTYSRTFGYDKAQKEKTITISSKEYKQLCYRSATLDEQLKKQAKQFEETIKELTAELEKCNADYLAVQQTAADLYIERAMKLSRIERQKKDAMAQGNARRVWFLEALESHIS